MAAWNNGQLTEVYRRLAEAEVEHIVVGGQAVNLWAEHYQAAAVFPEEVWLKLLPFTSSDLDLFGGSVDAIEAGKAFGVEAALYDPFAKTSSPNSGTLFLPMEDSGVAPAATRDLMVHFLHRVHGLNSDDVRVNALKLERAGVEVPVLHPLLCLEAKLSNLHDFDQQSPPRQDLKHARICTLAVRAFTAQRLAAGHVREVLDTFERIMRLAGRQSGLVAWHAHGLDLEDAIAHDALRSAAAGEEKIANFLESRWGQLRTILADRRARFEAVARQQNREPHPVQPLLDSG